MSNLSSSDADEFRGRLSAVELMVASMLAGMAAGHPDAPKAFAALRSIFDSHRGRFNNQRELAYAERAYERALDVAATVAKEMRIALKERGGSQAGGN